MSKDPVPIAAAPHMVVTIGVSSPLADRADGTILEHPEAEPVTQAQPEFLVL